MLSREGKREVKEIDKYDYYVALITVTATEEAGLRYMYND